MRARCSAAGSPAVNTGEACTLGADSGFMFVVPVSLATSEHVCEWAVHAMLLTMAVRGWGGGDPVTRYSIKVTNFCSSSGYKDKAKYLMIVGGSFPVFSM